MGASQSVQLCEQQRIQPPKSSQSRPSCDSSGSAVAWVVRQGSRRFAARLNRCHPAWSLLSRSTVVVSPDKGGGRGTACTPAQRLPNHRVQPIRASAADSRAVLPEGFAPCGPRSACPCPIPSGGSGLRAVVARPPRHLIDRRGSGCPSHRSLPTGTATGWDCCAAVAAGRRQQRLLQRSVAPDPGGGQLLAATGSAEACTRRDRLPHPVATQLHARIREPREE